MATTTVSCPECEAKLKVPDTIAPGKKIRCPKCKGVVTVPAAEEEPELEEEAVKPAAAHPRATAPPRKAPPREEADEEDIEAPPPRKPSRKPAPVEDEDESRPARKRGRQEKDADEEGEEEVPRSKRGRQPEAAVDEDEDEERPARKTKKGKKAQKSPVLLWSVIIGGAVLLIGGVVVVVLMNQNSGNLPGLKNQVGGKDGTKEKKDSPGDKPINPDKQIPTWKADSTLLNQLGAEVTVQSYHIRAPKGYKEVKIQVGGGDQLLFQGPIRAGGTVAILSFGVIPDPAGAQGQVSAVAFNNFLAGMKGSLQQNFSQINHSNVEQGTVNGITFFRARLSATAKRAQTKMLGFVYLSMEGGKAITTTFLDAEQDYPTSGKVAEAAALTVRKS